MTYKHEAVLRKAAAAVRDRGHEGDARLADSINGIIASLSAASPVQGAASTSKIPTFERPYVALKGVAESVRKDIAASLDTVDGAATSSASGAKYEFGKCVWCGASSNTRDRSCSAPDGDGHLFERAAQGASGAKGAAVKTWKERADEDSRANRPVEWKSVYMEREITDLRAALADRSPAVQQVAGQARGLLRELVQAMRGYQMGADHEGPAPEKHRDMMRRAEEFLATPAPEQEAAQVAPPGAQEVHLFRWKFQATWQDIGKAAMVALMEGESASSYEFRTLYTAPVPATTPEWTCFHCAERFTDHGAAALHFGTSERQDPICKVSQAEYRAMEARMVDYNNEDADIHRQMHRQRIEHHQALQRAEEAGYALGLRDAPAATPAEQPDGCCDNCAGFGEINGDTCPVCVPRATATNTNQPEGEKGGAA